LRRPPSCTLFPYTTLFRSLDEPTRGVDIGAKYEIYRIINEQVSRGVAVLVVSSDLPEALGISDRVLVVRGGRIVAELDRSEATEDRKSTRLNSSHVKISYA